MYKIDITECSKFHQIVDGENPKSFDSPFCSSYSFTKEFNSWISNLKTPCKIIDLYLSPGLKKLGLEFYNEEDYILFKLTFT